MNWEPPSGTAPGRIIILKKFLTLPLDAAFSVTIPQAQGDREPSRGTGVRRFLRAYERRKELTRSRNMYCIIKNKKRCISVN